MPTLRPMALLELRVKALRLGEYSSCTFEGFADDHSAPSGSQQSAPKPPKTPTRARGRKSGATAAARTKSLATRVSNASSAAPTTSMPDAAAGGVSDHMTGAIPGFGDLSSYMAATPPSFRETNMAGPVQPSVSLPQDDVYTKADAEQQGQLPLPELDQLAPTDLYANTTSHSYLEQLTAPVPDATQGFPSDASMDQLGFNTGFMDSQNFAMDTFGVSNGIMENQNGDDWDLNDPQFGDGKS